MPEGLGTIIALLVLGYLLLAAELFVPGAVLGILGFGAVVAGCYLAFALGSTWGVGAVALSLAVTVGGTVAFFKSNTAKRLMLSGEGAGAWKSQNESLAALTGKRGTTLSKLRPAGVVEIDGQRVDAEADGEFLDAGVPVRVALVEGNRVVVEAAETPASEERTDAEEPGALS